MKPLLTISTVAALSVWAARHKAKRKAIKRRQHLHFELYRLLPPGAMVLNRTGKPEYTFNQEQFDRLNRLAHGGDA